MDIKILGTRGNIEPSKPYHSKHTGYLINNELLIDLGEEVFMQNDPDFILFTHLHPDHAYFIEEGKTFNPGIPIFAPEEHESLPDANIIEDAFEINTYSVRPIPVIHSLKVRSLGYVIQNEDKQLFVSGDVAWIKKEEHEKINGSDAIITEASFIRKGGRIRRKDDKIYGHTGVPDLVRIFSPLTQRIIFTHYGSWFVNDVPNGKKRIQELESEEADLIPAYDGMELII